MESCWNQDRWASEETDLKTRRDLSGGDQMNQHWRLEGNRCYMKNVPLSRFKVKIPDIHVFHICHECINLVQVCRRPHLRLRQRVVSTLHFVVGFFGGGVKMLLSCSCKHQRVCRCRLWIKSSSCFSQGLGATCQVLRLIISESLHVDACVTLRCLMQGG